MWYIQERREIKILVGKPTSHLEGTGIDQKILKWFFNRVPGVEHIHLMQYWDQWHALVNMVKMLQNLYYAANFLCS